MSSQNKKLAAIAVIVIALGGGIIGWKIGQSNTKTSPANTGTSASTQPAANDASANDAKSLVSYTLPDGWKEGACPNNTDRTYVIPDGSSLRCDSNPSAPIKISVDPGNTTDCQQLANVQNVKKHICISLYINGHKTLKASTEYLKSSSLPSDITISEYYIDTGKGVVKLEYSYTSANDYQTGFDQLANSVKLKA